MNGFERTVTELDVLMRTQGRDCTVGFEIEEISSSHKLPLPKTM